MGGEAARVLCRPMKARCRTQLVCELVCTAQASEIHGVVAYSYRLPRTGMRPGVIT